MGVAHSHCNKLLIKEHLQYEMTEVCNTASAYIGSHFCHYPNRGKDGSVRDEYLIQYTLHSLKLQMLKYK